MTTSEQYSSIIKESRKIFESKLEDYGCSWRILRISSLTDQIYIKANRIRTLQETKEQKVDETIDSAFTAILNYGIIALIQLELGSADEPDLEFEKALEYYDKYSEKSKKLMEEKNHDYGEAWRDMRVSSLTDLILTKIFRIKQLEDNAENVIRSEGIDSNYYDIINYAVFALILMNESA